MAEPCSKGDDRMRSRGSSGLPLANIFIFFLVKKDGDRIRFLVNARPHFSRWDFGGPPFFLSMFGRGKNIKNCCKC